MISSPSPNGSIGVNGRDPKTGKFATGWKGGPGNPYAKKTAELRDALLNAVTKKDFADIAKALVRKAKRGDVQAARELIDRCLGKPKQTLDVDMEVDQTTNLSLDELIDRKYDQMPEEELIAEVICTGVYLRYGANTPIRRKIDLLISGCSDLPSDHFMRVMSEKVMALVNQKGGPFETDSQPLDAIEDTKSIAKIKTIKRSKGKRGKCKTSKKLIA